MLEVRGQPLLHSGADLGWFSAGEPVYAIADGVVRVSQQGLGARLAEAGRRLPTSSPVDYGNVIVIEHRTPQGETFSSLYGHLANNRLVHPGDLVTAGQQIGEIGRKGVTINGGYEPHVHFAITVGPRIEPGARLLGLTVNGQETRVELEELGEVRCRVRVTPDAPPGLRISAFGRTAELTRDEDGYTLPSFLLYGVQPRGAGARMAGYVPTLDGFRDPIAFLREHGADRKPAPLLHVTSCRDDDDPRSYVLGDAAPAWNVDEWVRNVDQPDLDVADFRGRVVALFCFDVLCSGSRTHGLPALTSVAEHFRHDGDVAVVGLQTSVLNRRRSTAEQLRKRARELPDGVAYGHCGQGPALPQIFDDYGLRGTPWIVLIDRNGVVQFSNYVVRPEEIIRRIDELK
jgi:hypothetical protein